MPASDLLACPDCDYLHIKNTLQRHERAYCVRCGALLEIFAHPNLHTTAALTLTGFMAWLLAVSFPIASVMIQTQQISATLLSIVETLNLQHYTVLAFLVLFTLAIAPLLELLAVTFVILTLHKQDADGIEHQRLAIATKLRTRIKPWVLIDVFMLGVLVALVKLKKIVIIELDVGLWAFLTLMAILYYLSFTLHVNHEYTHADAT